MATLLSSMSATRALSSSAPGCRRFLSPWSGLSSSILVMVPPLPLRSPSPTLRLLNASVSCSPIAIGLPTSFGARRSVVVTAPATRLLGASLSPRRLPSTVRSTVVVLAALAAATAVGVRFVISSTAPPGATVAAVPTSTAATSLAAATRGSILRLTTRGQGSRRDLPCLPVAL